MVAILCAVFSIVVGTLSVGEAVALMELQEVQKTQATLPLEVDPSLLQRFEEGRLKALHPMRGPRSFVLLALSMATGFAFVGSLRLLRPAGFSREAARRLTSSSALAAALLRTVDGAQQAVVAQKTGKYLADVVVAAAKPADAAAAEALRQAAPSWTVGWTIFLTFLVAGCFAGVWQYLRSNRARELLGSAQVL
jgi:hypothetical protein